MPPFRRAYFTFSTSVNNLLLLNCSSVNPCFLFSQLRHKGHSHWQNVMKSKQAGDRLKSSIIGNFCNRVKVIVREFGPDPKINTQLERLMIDAVRNNVPKDSILRAIDQAVNKPIMPFLFEYKGPSGSFFIIEALSDSRYWLQGQLNYRLKKVPGGFKCKEAKDVDVRSYFEHIGSVKLLEDSAPPKSEDTSSSTTTKEAPSKKAWNAPPPIQYPPPLNFEHAETLAIELNALSVNQCSDDEGRPAYEIICEPEHVKRIQKELTSKNYAVFKATQEFRPFCRVPLNPQHMSYVDQFYAALDDMEEIQAIFDNVLFEGEDND